MEASGGAERSVIIKLLAVGTRMPSWVEEAFSDYAKRLPKNFQLQLVEIAAEKRRNVSADTARKAEAERILAKVSTTDTLVMLDETGTGFGTVAFANKLKNWQEAGSSPVLLIGGADGLHQRCRERANLVMQVSDLTLPHGMVRVVLAEQVYRAWSLLNHHPYHRA